MLQGGWKYCNGKYCNGVGNIATPLEILQPLLDLKLFVGNIATNFREQVFSSLIHIFLLWTAKIREVRRKASRFIGSMAFLDSEIKYPTQIRPQSENNGSS